MKKIVQLRLPPYSPSLPSPSSNVVREDMIDIVEIDVGKLVRSYITSTTLLEGGEDMIDIVEIDVGKLVRSYITSTTLLDGGRGWNENFFPFSPRVLL